MNCEDVKLARAYRDGLIEGRTQREEELGREVHNLRRTLGIVFDYLYDLLPDECQKAITAEIREIK